MDKILNYIGLAYRANKILLGEEILNSFRYHRIKLLFLASDISTKSKERYLKKCYFYQVNFINDYDCKALSTCLGRSLVKTLAITDEGLAKAILKERGCQDGQNKKENK